MYALRRRRLRAFTLVELIVVFLVLGVLAAVAVVSYGGLTARAHATAARTTLAQMATAVLAQATSDGGTTLTYDQVVAAMTDSGATVTAGLGAAQAWRLGGYDDTPTGANEFAVGFVNDGVLADDRGTTAALLTSTPEGDVYAAIISLGGTHTNAGALVQQETGTRPMDVLGGVPAVPAAPAVGVDGVSADQVTFAWGSVAGAVSYIVETKVDDGAWSAPQVVSSTIYKVSGLGPSQTAWVRVSAVNAGGNGPLSETVSGTTPPAVPGVATVTFTGATGASATFEWAAVGGATSYTVETKIGAGEWSAPEPVTAPTYLVSGLPNDTTVSVRVTAVNAGGSGPVSTPASGTTLPAPPASPVASFTTSTSTSATFGWSAVAGATVYRVEFQIGAGSWSAPQTTTATTWTVTGVASGATVSLRVSATNTGGASAVSATASGTTVLVAPAATPEVTNNSKSATTLGFIWSAVPNATEYVVDYQINGGAWQQLLETNLSRKFTGLTSPTTIAVRVTARNAAGTGPTSTTLSATTS